jgi:hypothetical protein
VEINNEDMQAISLINDDQLALLTPEQRQGIGKIIQSIRTFLSQHEYAGKPNNKPLRSIK